MQRIVLGVVGLMLLGAPVLVGQEARQPAHVYEAYYRVSFSDLSKWNQQYWTYAVPILQKLREEGVIQGFGQWQHETGGGDYNIRFVARTYDWASLGEFWSEYLSRLQAAVPPAEWTASSRMVVEHRDEIWDIVEVNVPDDLQTGYMYASTFLVNFADMAEWNRMWKDVAGPLLTQAMSDGTLGGWVRLGHNTGGPHNSKVLYMFESWDTIDDFFGKLLSTMAEKHPDQWAQINQLFQAHDDAIWAPTSQAGM